MNKKVMLFVLAVLAFFAGQIFLEESLAAAGAPAKTFAEFLVPVFELVAGGFLGYFFKKFEYEELAAKITTKKVAPKAKATKSSTKKKTTKVS